MKVDRKSYKGIDFVLLQDLPKDQQEKFIQSKGSSDLFIKILIDGKIVGQCIQYKDYSFWYDSEFKAEVIPVTEKPRKDVVLTPNLVLNKA